MRQYMYTYLCIALLQNVKFVDFIVMFIIIIFYYYTTHTTENKHINVSIHAKCDIEKVMRKKSLLSIL